MSIFRNNEPETTTAASSGGSGAISSDDLRNRRRRIGLIAIGLIAILIIAAIFILKRRGADKEEAEKVVVSVQVAKATRGPISQTAAALGTIFPRLQSTVSAKIASQIKTMAIVKNKAVKSGDVIAVLETRDLQAQQAEAEAALKEAEFTLNGLSTGQIPQTIAQDEKAIRDATANLQNAQATYDRRKKLYDQGGISIKDLQASELAVKTSENDLRLSQSTLKLHQTSINPNDRAVAESKVKQAQERLQTLNAQLSYAEIKAPYDGVITDQFKFQGDFVSAGEKLFNIGDVTQVIVKAPFPDTVATNLKTGDPADVEPADTPGQKLSGSVTLVSRAGDPASRTFEVWVTLPNTAGALRPGSSARVSVDAQTISDAITVPAAAVTLDAANAGTGSVMVVDDKSIAHEVKVKVGIKSGDTVQITSGLNGGETVVTEGNYALPDGTEVKVGEAASGGDTDKDSDKDKD